MGLLTTAQREAIAAGAPLRQQWLLLVPSDYIRASATYAYVYLHDDLLAIRRVVKAGHREQHCYNVTLQQEGKLEVGKYTFVCDNSDFALTPFISGTLFEHPTSHYQSDPISCYIEHRVYVMTPSGESELPLTYKGRIMSMDYEDVVGLDGASRGQLCTIETEATGVTEVLRTEWTEDHADDEDTGLDVSI